MGYMVTIRFHDGEELRDYSVARAVKQAQVTARNPQEVESAVVLFQDGRTLELAPSVWTNLETGEWARQSEILLVERDSIETMVDTAQVLPDGSPSI